MVAAAPLDLARRLAPLPQADEPQPADPEVGQPVKLLVGDRIERVDVAGVLPRELVEPNVGALRDEHEPRHPLEILAEPFGFEVPTDVVLRTDSDADERSHAVAPAATAEPKMEGTLLLGH